VAFECPVEVLTWIDTETIIRSEEQGAPKHRGPVIVEILNEWVKKQKHAHMMRLRVIGSNPTEADSTEVAA
jgi:hypothetical protein